MKTAFRDWDVTDAGSHTKFRENSISQTKRTRIERKKKSNYTLS